jgi:hypothetical protein
MPGDRARIKDRDHQHAADIVDDGQRGRKTLRPVGSGRTIARALRAAMSVAIGMAHPRAATPRRRQNVIVAGMAIPPIAPAIGSAAWRRGELLPATALDLETDQQEEDRHQPVVDHPMKRQRQGARRRQP